MKKLLLLLILLGTSTINAQDCFCDNVYVSQSSNYNNFNNFNYFKVEMNNFQYYIINLDGDEKYRTYINVYVESDNYFKNNVPVINGCIPSIYTKKDSNKNVIGFILDYSSKIDVNKTFLKKDGYIIYKDVVASPVNTTTKKPAATRVPSAVKPSDFKSDIPSAVKSDLEIKASKIEDTNTFHGSSVKSNLTIDKEIKDLLKK